MLDAQVWGTGKIEATPHGHFAKMLGDAEAPPSPEAQHKNYKSSVMFNHYNPPLGRAVTDAEFPNGKRVNYPERTGIGRKLTEMNLDSEAY